MDNDFLVFTLIFGLIFWPYNVFLLTFIMFRHVKIGKHIEYMRQKLSKNKLIVKFHPGGSVYTSFFLLFIPERNSIPVLNIKRHFTIDRDDFIPG